MTKIEIKNFFKSKLAVDSNWAVKGMLRIYEFQTASEQATGATRDHNNVGFSGCDGEILSSFCEQVKKGRILSPKQMALVFKKMPRYWKQLAAVAGQEAIEKAYLSHITKESEKEEVAA